jgi:hypothetical protein
MLGTIERNGKHYSCSKKLACKVNNGIVDDYGIPIIAEPDADNNRFIKLFGIQMGLHFEEIAENRFQSQCGAVYAICDYE